MKILQIYFKGGSINNVFYGWFYKLALTDCDTIFEVNLFVSEGV